jgi:hypothetical protein
VKAELRVLVMVVGIGLGVLFPEQLAGKAFAFEFLMNGREIGLRVNRLGWAMSGGKSFRLI